MQGKNNLKDLEKLFSKNLYKNSNRETQLKAIRSVTYDNYIEAKEEVLGKKNLSAKEKREKKRMTKKLSKLKKIVGG